LAGVSAHTDADIGTDDRSIVCDGLADLIEREYGMRFVGIASSGEESKRYFGPRQSALP
jgi:YesN/AraC family two-component response regulator